MTKEKNRYEWRGEMKERARQRQWKVKTRHKKGTGHKRHKGRQEKEGRKRGKVQEVKERKHKTLKV